MLWEERWHPLREEWVVVAAHRQDRPWIGEAAPAEAAAETVPEHDPACTFCPGNARVSGAVNPRYEGVWIFDNDRPCVGAGAPEPAPLQPPFAARAARGEARVVCFDPRHDRSLASLGEDGVRRVLAAYRDESRRLSARKDIAHVLMFENRGAAVGVSNPHPHGQLYAVNFVFKTIETETRAAARWHAERGGTLLGAVLREEVSDGRRMLFDSAGAAAFVPHFARWAYEAYVMPQAARARLAELDDDDLDAVAGALHRVLVMYDRLWGRPFPYVMAFHDAPNHEAAPGFHWHVELHPPLRKPGLLKHLAGPETGGGSFLADTSPEEKAAELRGGT